MMFGFRNGVLHILLLTPHRFLNVLVPFSESILPSLLPSPPQVPPSLKWKMCEVQDYLGDFRETSRADDVRSFTVSPHVLPVQFDHHILSTKMKDVARKKTS